MNLLADYPKSLIEELESSISKKNTSSIIETRASHIIASAIALIELIDESFPPEEAEDLVKRFHRSIISKDKNKFIRKLKQLRKDSK